MRKNNALMLLVGLLVACQSSGGPAAFSATIPAAQPQQRVAVAAAAGVNTAVPTINHAPSRTPTSLPTATLTATRAATSTMVPTNTPRVTAISISSATPNNGPTTDANGTPLPTWTPPPDDPATRIDDHYRLRRPIGQGMTNWVDRTYPYGGTQGGRLQTHHGVEFVNSRGTPVLAAGDGTVYYAGDDLTTMFGPINNYYGRLIIIQHDFTAPDGSPVYSLYGHLERWDVEAGMRVGTGDQIGLVGATGVAQGPHVHFEVRVGDPTSFDVTRNPELWIYPFQTFGTLAGRVVDANGTFLYAAPIQVKSATVARYAFTYADDTVNPDPAFGENFTLGDLPANYYDVSVTADGRVRFQKTIYVYPNRTTWVDIQLSE